MQSSSRGHGGEITKGELLKITPFSKGQLTKLYNEGYLPKPDRRSRPGSKTPVYVWDASVIERAKFLYDLLQWDRSNQRLRLPLWLQGYSVEFAPLRQQWLQSFDPNLWEFTQSDADNPLDVITDVVTRLEYKWEHTPTRRRPQPIRQYGLANYAQWVEWFLVWTLVTDAKLVETTFAALLGEDLLSWLQKLHEILAFPHLCEVIEQATPDAWEEARLDYMTLCQFFQTITATLGWEDQREPDFSVFVFGGFFLVPAALAIRQRGYGYWIDDGFSWVRTWLADADTQAVLSWAATPEVRALLSSAEGRAQFMEQVSRRQAQVLT